MKKVVLLTLAIIGLIAMDASAWGRRGYGYGYNRGGCNSCAPSCAPACNPCNPCAKVCRVEEEPMPPAKCCECVYTVRKPCEYTKHIYYTCDCPADCVEAGTLNTAGEVVEY